MAQPHDHGHDHGDHHDHRHSPAAAPAGPQGHDHDHGHGHGHSHAHHAPADFSRAFAIGIALNLGFVGLEAFYGWRVNSLALLADAGHNLSDVAGLLLAWGGALAAKRPADERNTYGWRRAGIIAAWLNGGILLVAMGSLGWEAIGRLQAPQAVQGWTVMAVAAVGILVNGATALLFFHGRDDLNIRGAFWHMAGDALVSLGVVLAGGLVLWQGWTWVDPAASLLIALVIIAASWGLFRQAMHLMLDGVPEGIDLPAVRQALLALPGVTEVHDLHVWAMGTRETALTAHLVQAQPPQADLLTLAAELLAQRFKIQHSTLQLETPAQAAQCALRSGGHCG